MEREERIEVVSQILGTMPSIKKFFMGKTKERKSGFGNAPFMVMHVLEHHGCMNMTQVARESCITNQQMTKVVDALAEKGFVNRRMDQSNRRVINIELTDEGQEELKRIYQSLVESAADKFEDFSEEEMYCLRKSFLDIQEIFSRERN